MIAVKIATASKLSEDRDHSTDSMPQFPTVLYQYYGKEAGSNGQVARWLRLLILFQMKWKELKSQNQASEYIESGSIYFDVNEGPEVTKVSDYGFAIDSEKDKGVTVAPAAEFISSSSEVMTSSLHLFLNQLCLDADLILTDDVVRNKSLWNQ